jgi:hypothetical protein
VGARLVPSFASRLDGLPEEHILGDQDWDTKNTIEVPVAVVADACADALDAQVVVGRSSAGSDVAGILMGEEMDSRLVYHSQSFALVEK